METFKNSLFSVPGQPKFEEICGEFGICRRNEE